MQRKILDQSSKTEIKVQAQAWHHKFHEFKKSSKPQKLKC